MKFKFIEHTADIKFNAFGEKIEDCFINAAYALKETVSSEKIKPQIKKNITFFGKDYENLLYNFLESLLFFIDTKNLIISKINKIHLSETKKRKKLVLEIYFDNLKKYKTITDIKAITYNEMFVKKEKKRYICQVVLDV